MTRALHCNRLLYSLIMGLALPQTMAVADVTFFGSVSPDPPGDGDVESVLVVGLQGDDDPDFRGYVRIDGGTQIEYDSLIVGDDQGYQGELVISGTLTPGGQSRLMLEEAGSAANPTAQIGHEGVGSITIEGGGSLLFKSAAADLSIGVESSGVGTLTVRGTFSLVVIPDTHIIGEDGIGRMEILDGGMVHASDLTNTALVGAGATCVGSVLVDGAGSIWKVDDNLSVGTIGVGTLTVSNQGLVDVDRLDAVTTIGGNGRLNLAGGTVAADTVVLNGTLDGSGLLRGELTASVGALIDVPENGLLEFTNDVHNQGSIRIRGGEVAFLATLNNLAAGGAASPGRITLEAGRIGWSDPLTNDGVIAATTGSNHLHGEIAGGAGAIVIASHALATFYDPVDIATGSLELLAGANALFLADLTFQTGSLGTLQLGETAGGSSQIQVSGAAALAGELVVEFAGGLSPGIGDSFQLLSAAGGITGAFSDVDLPALDAGLFWNLDYGSTNVVLEVLAIAPADFNRDGQVNGDDLAVWEASFGTDAGGDADGDGMTGSSDFLEWQRTQSPAASAVAHSVPEPTTLLLSLLGLSAVGISNRRNSKRSVTA